MKKWILAIIITAIAMLNVHAGAHAKVQLWAGGPYWATTNIGAENPEDYGLYFWWGDTTGYKPVNGAFNFEFTRTDRTAPTYHKSLEMLQSEGWITADGVLAPAHDAAHVQWGGGWRMPTYQELYDLRYKCDWTWTTTNGVSGCIVSGRGAYTSNNIFLPAAGDGYWSEIAGAGSQVSCWSSVPVQDNTSFGSFRSWDLSVTRSVGTYTQSCRDYGLPVRPVQGSTEALFSIVFNANRGTGTMEAQTFEIGKKQKLSKNLFKKDGYVFQGWAETDDGPVVYADEQEITVDHDMTLYAVWANPPLTLTAESADWSSGSITLRCEDADKSGAEHSYTLEYYNENGTWVAVDDAQVSVTRGQNANNEEVWIAELTDTDFSSRLGGIPTVEYRVKDENERVSEPYVTRTRYGLAVGLGSYAPKMYKKYPKLSDLPQCRQDAELANEVMTQCGGGIASSNMKLLRDAEATIEGITNAWRRLGNELKPGDVVFFFLATHGWYTGVLAYDDLYTMKMFQNDIEPFRSGALTGVKVVAVLMNCFSENMTSDIGDVEFEYGSMCTPNILYVAVADAEENEANIACDDNNQSKITYTTSGEFFLNQGLKKRRADCLTTLHGIEGNFGNNDGVVDLLESTQYLGALSIGRSDKHTTHVQYDLFKRDLMKKTIMVVGNSSSQVSAPQAPQITSVSTRCNLISSGVTINWNRVENAQYYIISYSRWGDAVSHWYVSDGRNVSAFLSTADGATAKDRKYYVPLENDEFYQFSMIAVNAAGRSEEGNTVTEKTEPARRNPVYNVFFKANGGSVSTSFWEVEEGQLLGDLPVPVSNGRTFLGWYTSPIGGFEVGKSYMVTKDDITCYAHWSDLGIRIPAEWLRCFPSFQMYSGGDIATAAAMPAANGCRTVGECYALGINPEDPNDDLKISHFEMKDGKPVITLNHTEDGSGNSFTPRVKTLGKENLSDAEWREVPTEGDQSLRFFKVKVELP